MSVQGVYRKADIDVVVLSYNHGLFIEQSVRSILNQKTEFTFNLIVADDCSSDDTSRIIKNLMNEYERLIFLTSESNNGSIKNAQRAIALCQSDFLAFCEADDYWLDENKLQLQMQFLKSNLGFEMVHGDVAYHYQSKNLIGESVNTGKDIVFPSGDIFEDYLTNQNLFIFTASVMVKTELFKACADYALFASKGWMAQDLPTWLEISRRTQIGYMNKMLAAYRLLDESASRSKSPEYIYRFHQSIFDIRYYYWAKYSGKSYLKEKLDLMYSFSLLSDLRRLNQRKLWYELTRLKFNSDITWSPKRWIQYFYSTILVFIKGK